MSALRPVLRLAVGDVRAVLPLEGGDLLVATEGGALKRLGPEGPRWSLEGVAPAQASLTALPGGRVAVWGKDQQLKIVDLGSQEIVRSLDHGRGWGDNQVHQVELLGEEQLLSCDSQGILRGTRSVNAPTSGASTKTIAIDIELIRAKSASLPPASSVSQIGK